MTPLSLDQPWGRGSSARHSHTFGDGRAFPRTSGNVLPRGLGRSYGDVCVNDGGTLMHTFRRDRLLAFDDVQGRLTCEAGALLADIAQTLLPRGWFLPVVPGTRFVTVGGAIANDVHGKNHHISGTFGRAVRRITLRRSDSGVHMLDAPNPLLAHTIGGLGLTGMIEDVTLQLSRVPGPGIAQETTLFGGKNSDAGIDDYLALDAESKDWNYTVAWIDTMDENLRGVFFRGNHCDGPRDWLTPNATKLTLPIDAPQWLLGRWSARAFNAAYYRAQALQTAKRATTPLWQFFFPLDAVNAWNRAYGKRGFIQYQFVVPTDAARETVPRILAHLRESNVASYLAVIKTFGDLPSPGLLSFPMAGTTVALDIPAPNDNDRRALDRADAMVADVGGRVYPAKDARMSAAMFQRFFPQWRELEAMRDPMISSSFWRRVTREVQ
ncbi:MAG TPA: FAD-binding oxidoreductase [Casimicrobium sp.]|jgi:FAD/FMN-containing dehydrogenase|nr:FAD-binding oxidoreductase [Casimicrobium sp.]